MSNDNRLNLNSEQGQRPVNSEQPKTENIFTTIGSVIFQCLSNTVNFVLRPFTSSINRQPIDERTASDTTPRETQSPANSKQRVMNVIKSDPELYSKIAEIKGGREDWRIENWAWHIRPEDALNAKDDNEIKQLILAAIKIQEIVEENDGDLRQQITELGGHPDFVEPWIKDNISLTEALEIGLENKDRIREFIQNKIPREIQAIAKIQKIIENDEGLKVQIMKLRDRVESWANKSISPTEALNVDTKDSRVVERLVQEAIRVREIINSNGSLKAQIKKVAGGSNFVASWIRNNISLTDVMKAGTNDAIKELIQAKIDKPVMNKVMSAISDNENIEDLLDSFIGNGEGINREVAKQWIKSDILNTPEIKDLIIRGINQPKKIQEALMCALALKIVQSDGNLWQQVMQLADHSGNILEWLKDNISLKDISDANVNDKDTFKQLILAAAKLDKIAKIPDEPMQSAARLHKMTPEDWIRKHIRPMDIRDILTANAGDDEAIERSLRSKIIAQMIETWKQ